MVLQLAAEGRKSDVQEGRVFNIERERLIRGSAYFFATSSRSGDSTSFVSAGSNSSFDSALDGQYLFSTHSKCWWYHVHEHWELCSLCSSWTPSKAPLSTAVPVAWRLPLDVIRMIGLAVADDPNTRYGQKHVQMAMVCEYWAEACLRHPVDASVHGANDVMVLRKLVSAPASYLKDIIKSFHRFTNDTLIRADDKEITLPLSTMEDPWLHLLPETRRLLTNYDQTEEYTPHLIGPLGGGLRTMRSIHAYLPRTLPQFSGNISRLMLNSIVFQRFCDLEHVLNEIRGLQWFQGCGLSWKSSSAWARRPTRHRKAQRRGDWWSPEMSLRNCTSDVEVARLTIDPREQVDYWVVLRSVLQFLMPSPVDSDLIVGASSKYEDYQAGNASKKVLHHVHCVNSLWQYSVSLRVVQTWRNNTLDPHRMELAVSFSSRGNPYCLTLQPLLARYIAWRDLDEALMAHPQVVSVTFSMRSSEQSSLESSIMELEMQDIASSLPRSSAAGKLRFSSASIDAFCREWGKVWENRAQKGENRV